MQDSSLPTTQPQGQSRRLLLILIGIAISVIFLFLAFRGLQPEAFISSLSDLNPTWLLIGALVYGLAVTVIALRWQFLLNSVQRVALFPLTKIVAIGYMGNNVYPLRAGEALRVLLLRRNHGVRLAGSATTVVLERVFDGIVMLTFILIGLAGATVQSEEVRLVASIATPIFGIAVLVFFTLAAFPAVLRRLVEIIAKLLPTTLSEILLRISEDIIDGLSSLRSPVQLFGAVIASYTTWAIEAGVYWLVMQAFGLDLSYAVALLAVGTVNLAGLIPASPGQVGVYEFFVSSVLIAVGVAQDTALAYAIVVHLVIWLPVTLAGFGFLVQQGLGWSDIRKAQQIEAA